MKLFDTLKRWWQWYLQPPDQDAIRMAPLDPKTNEERKAWEYRVLTVEADEPLKAEPWKTVPPLRVAELKPDANTVYVLWWEAILNPAHLGAIRTNLKEKGLSFVLIHGVRKPEIYTLVKDQIETEEKKNA